MKARSATFVLSSSLVLVVACSSHDLPTGGADAASEASSSSGGGQDTGSGPWSDGSSGPPADASAGSSSESDESSPDAVLEDVLDDVSTDAMTMRNVGDPCTSDDQCPALAGEAPLCMKDWPGGGYCTTDSCGPCPGGASCTAYQGTNRCFAACEPGVVPCRAGYPCLNSTCVPL